MFGDIFTGNFWHFDSLNYDRAMCLLLVMGLEGCLELVQNGNLFGHQSPRTHPYELKHQRAVKFWRDLGAV